MSCAKRDPGAGWASGAMGVTQGPELSVGEIGGADLVAAEQVDVVVPEWR